MTKKQAKEKIKKLVDEYEDLKFNNLLKDQNEAFTKQRFIQPFFEALGWDFRIDVWPEENVSKDRVDYAFKIGDFTKFFVEAKKFSVDLEEVKWAEQAIDYAYNKSVIWAVLSDFEGLKIFNSEWNKKPYRAVKEFTYKDYLTRFDEIWFLSKESIENGELDKKAEEWGVKEKKVPVTEQLAQDLTEWRDGLRKEIDVWNKGKFSDEEINEAVQRFLDRLIFIRYAEDKGLEPPTLEPILREFKKSGGDLIKKLNKVFRQFDDWYDSRLFEKHFSEEMEAYSGELEKIMGGLYRSKETGHPYDFSIIPADVLGAVYEQYLGYLQKKETKSKRKEQGIYYTPSFIVDYIVQNTLGVILKEKVKSEIKNIKILDPACGSGSFLIKAYQKLIDYYQKEINHKIDTKSKLGKIEKLMMEKKGIQELSVAQKLNILRENIYGVDLDPKAVEIAQLNLLLKAIVKRTKLPNLSHKIVCGNSLISGDEKILKSYFGDEWKEKKPFNWEEEFNEVFQKNKEEYDGQAYHITWVTHNSRVSERMVQFGVQKGEPVLLNGNDEVEITKYILQIVQEEKLRVLTYNISRDHVHMLLICDENKRDNIVRKLKGKSTQLYKQNHGLKEEFHLWAQKYSCTFIESDEQMANTMEYIQHNREKHKLARNNGLQPIVASMITPFADAFAPTSQQGGFDVVIGNPPYVDVRKIDTQTKRYLFDKYSCTENRTNTFAIFIESSLSHLKEGGKLGFIIPNTFLTHSSYKKLREKILKECVIESIFSLGSGVFKSATVETIILILIKTEDIGIKKDGIIRIHKIDNGRMLDFNIKQSFFNSDNEKRFILRQDQKINSLINKIKSVSIELGQIYHGYNGINPGNQKEKIVAKNKIDQRYRKVIDGKNIKRYSIKWNNDWILYDKKILERARDEKIFLVKPKIMLQKIGTKLVAGLDHEQLYALINTTILLNKDSEYDQKYILALLNSELMNFFYKQEFLGVQIKTEFLNILPIHKINFSNAQEKGKYRRILKSIEQILSLNNELLKISANFDQYNRLKHEIEKFDHQIDEEVYKLYGLTEEEIKIIERSQNEKN